MQVLILIVVEDGLVPIMKKNEFKFDDVVLILIVVEDGLVLLIKQLIIILLRVLILIVVEDGLVRFTNYHLINKFLS